MASPPSCNGACSSIRRGIGGEIVRGRLQHRASAGPALIARFLRHAGQDFRHTGRGAWTGCPGASACRQCSSGSRDRRPAPSAPVAAISAVSAPPAVIGDVGELDAEGAAEAAADFGILSSVMRPATVFSNLRGCAFTCIRAGWQES